MKKKKENTFIECVHNACPWTCDLCGINKLDPDQLAALKFLCEDDNIFFTILAPAGFGKSYFIEHLCRNIPKVCATALTGRAAQIINGSTLHSWIGTHKNFGVINSKKANSRASERNCQILIIDEISMATSKLFDQLLYRFSLANRKNSLPKILVLGDLGQLPPIDGSPWWEHELWSKFKHLKLTHNHRQKDKLFINALSDIREGLFNKETIDLLKTREVKELPQDCVWILPFREQVRLRNEKCINDLEGHLYETHWTVKYAPRKHSIDNLEDKTRLQECVQLKINARILLTSNDKEGKWINGSSGTVLALEKGNVKVELDSGKIVNVHKIEDEIYDADRDLICSIFQFPIKLGYASTIHGCQGSTMDRVGIDVRGAFAAGMIYVGLSRCRTLEGLHILGQITKENLLVDEKALKIQRGEL